LKQNNLQHSQGIGSGDTIRTHLCPYFRQICAFRFQSITELCQSQHTITIRVHLFEYVEQSNNLGEIFEASQLKSKYWIMDHDKHFWLTSSSGKNMARIFRASFLKRFMAANCCSLVTTASGTTQELESNFKSVLDPKSLLSQGWASNSEIVALLLGSLQSILKALILMLIKSLVV
jgi:hypothetical protein